MNTQSVLLPFLAFLSVVFSFRLEFLDYQDDICSFVDGDPGNCLPLRDCNSLMKIIQIRPILKKNLQLLVNLTCEFDLEEPKVCCPDDDGHDTEPAPAWASIPREKPTTTRRTPLALVAPPPNHDPSLGNHRNFRKIPSFEKCSLSLTSYLRAATSDAKVFRGQFPWVALLGYRHPISRKLEFLCGGTVITRENILTSAYCTNLEGYGKPVTVRLAEHDLATNPDCVNAAQLGCSSHQDFQIKKIVPHNLFNFTAAKRQLDFVHDIAVLRLVQKVKFDIYVQPICLPFVRDYHLISFPKKLDSVEKSYSSGWENLSKFPSSFYGTLQLSEFPIKPNEECGLQYYQTTLVRPSQICAGSDAPLNCSVNTGSALMIRHSEWSRTKYVQVGITSYGPFHCREHPIPGIFTKITPYLEFILDALD